MRWRDVRTMSQLV